MDKLYKIYLINEADEYYYLDSNGDVATQVGAKAINDDPAEWEDITAQCDRVEISHGVYTRYLENLLFQGDGAKILRSIFYTKHFRGYCKVRIEKQNRNFVPQDWLYRLWFEAFIDFALCKDGSTDDPPGSVYFQATMIEKGLQDVLESRIDETFEIPIYDTWDPIPANRVLNADAKEIEIKNMRMDSHYEWVIPETLDSSGSDAFESGDWSPPIGNIKSDSVFEVIQATSQVDVGAGITNTYFLKAVQVVDTVIKVKFSGEFKNVGPNPDTIGYNLQLLIMEPGNPIPVNSGTDIIWTDTQNLAAGATFQFDVDVTYPYTLIPGYVVGLRFFVIPSPAVPPSIRVTSDGLITLDAVYSSPASRCFAFTYLDLANKLLEKMSNGNPAYSVVSDLLLDTFGSDVNYFTRPVFNMVTCSASLRNLDDPRIKTSWNELMNDLNTMFGIGWGIEGDEVRIERAPYFYQKDTEFITINTNSTVNKSVAQDYLYNRIKIGFNDTSVDEINGLQEFCCEHEYNCGISSPTIATKELALLSPYIHGCYSIENIRSYLFRSDSTSTPTDNETCVIEVNNLVGGVYEPAKSGFDGTTFKNGLKYPADVYNIGHSPKACLIRNLPYIKSFLLDGDVITFNTATKNANVEYGNAFVTVVDKSNIEITANGAKIPSTSDLYPDIYRIFLPYIFEFEGEVPENLLTIMEDQVLGVFKKYGAITINEGDNELKGFSLDIGVTPATDDVYQIRLLCSPDVDLSKFIQ